MPLLHIQLLGKFHLSHESMAINLNSPRQQSLPAYLLLHRNDSLRRQQVAFALLPDSSERQGRTNLRRELHHLRRALPDADRFLHVDHQRLQWHAAAPFTLDVAEFEEAKARADRASAAEDRDAEQGALKEAAEIYTGDLLPGCYDDWIQPARDRLAQSYIQTLERLCDLLEKARAYQSAIEYAQRLLRHDALREATYRRLMRLHALGGDRARALRVYHNCVTTLRRELGVEPDPATRKAHERLLQVDEAPSQPATQPLSTQPPSTTPPATQPPATSLAAEIHLIGRQPEWATLQSIWQSAARGRAHCAIVVGEAGIGKTRLVEELTGWAARQGIASARTRSFAAEGLLAYAPVVEWLRTDTLRAALPHLDDVWLTEISRLLPELRSERSNLPPPQPLSESWQRQNLFEALTQAVLLNDATMQRPGPQRHDR